VVDEGIGVADDVITKLFDPFFTTKSAGMAMGLSVSRSIVESHGGEIRASANRGPGATFEFTLPTLGGTAPAVAA
jgi:signal transduction histidine kinase